MKDIKDDTYLLLPSEGEAAKDESARLYDIVGLTGMGRVHEEGSSEKGTLLYDDGYHRVVLPSGDNKNSVVLGKTGYNKSTGAVYSLAADAVAKGHNLILTDPKGELLSNLGTLLVQSGYNVLNYDPQRPETSSNLNMLAYASERFHAGDEALARKLVVNLVDALFPHDREPRERSWNDATQKVAYGEMMTLVKYGCGECSFLAAATLHSDLFGDNSMKNEILKDGFRRDEDLWGCMSYAFNNATQTKGSIISPVGSGFTAMSDTEGKKKVFNSNTTPFDLTKPLAVFVRSDNEVAVGATSVVVEFFRTLIEVTQPGREFLFNLDETGNYVLPSLPRLFSLMRGYGCYVNIVLQSASQLDMYHGDRQTILDNVHTWYVYSCDDLNLAGTLILRSPIGPKGHVLTPDAISEIPKVRGRLLVETDTLAGLTWFRPCFERDTIKYEHVGDSGGKAIRGEGFLESFLNHDLGTPTQASGTGGGILLDDCLGGFFSDAGFLPAEDSDGLFVIDDYDDFDDDEFFNDDSMVFRQIEASIRRLGYGSPTDKSLLADIFRRSLGNGLADALDSMRENARSFLEKDGFDPLADMVKVGLDEELAVRTIMGFPELVRSAPDTSGAVAIGEGVYRLDSRTHEAEILVGAIARGGMVEYGGETYMVTSVGDYARLLTDTAGELYLPPSVRRIGKCAFLNRTDLERISLDAVSEIGDFAFCGCSSLGPFICLVDAAVLGRYCFAATSVLGVRLNPFLREIPEGMFMNARRLSSVIIPDPTQVIGDFAFKNSGLDEFTLPPRIVSLGESAFENIDGSPECQTVVLPKTLRFVGRHALAHIGILHVVINGTFKAGERIFAYNRLVEVEDNSGEDNFVRKLLESD